MKRSQRFSRRALIRYWCALLTAGLIVGASLTVDPAAKALAQADEKNPAADTEEPAADEEAQIRVFSGPQTGEEIRPFRVLRVKDNETEELEIVKETDERTTLICFVHKLSNDDRILYGLGMVDFYGLRHDDLTSHFVLLSDERDKLMPMLKGWSQGSLFKKSFVSLSADGSEGPGYYGLNRHVAMTVVVARGNKVVSNLVFNAPNNNDLQKIMAAVAEAYGEPAPTLASVQQELRAERQRQMDIRLKASRVFKIAPAEEPGRIMFGMVNGRGNQTQNAKRRSQQLLDWAGDDKERKVALKEYCKAVLAGDFDLNRYSREAIEKLAGD